MPPFFNPSNTRFDYNSRPVDRHEIVRDKSIEELNAQLVSLVGEDGAQLLVGALRSRRSISGPELTK
jgi:hypothetical protein